MQQTQLRGQDFDEFCRWYSARRHRMTGAPAKPSTLKSKRVHLVTAGKESGCSDPLSLAHLLTDRERVEYLLDRVAMRMSPGAMRSVVEALRQFGEFAQIQGWLSSSCTVTRADVPAKNPPRPIVVYGADEVERMVLASLGRGVRWWAFMATMADTGRRVGEVLSFEWSWFRLAELPAYVELPVTKNGEPQYVPLGRRLREEVFTPENVVRLKRQEKGRYGGTFARSTEVHPFPWGYSAVMGTFRRFCADIGVEYRGLHCLRHTLITRRIADGVPIQAVAALAGHSSPATTLARYSHATALDYMRYVD